MDYYEEQVALLEEDFDNGVISDKEFIRAMRELRECYEAQDEDDGQW